MVDCVAVAFSAARASLACVSCLQIFACRLLAVAGLDLIRRKCN